MAVLTCDNDNGILSVKREEDEDRGKRIPSWAAPTRLNFDSILKVITNNLNIHSDNASSSDRDSSFSWNWKWEPIDFKTSSVDCPKALSTLLGRRFSACSALGLCPSPCPTPTNGCTCKQYRFQPSTPVNTANVNIDDGHDIDANHLSVPPSSAQAITPTENLSETSPVGSPIGRSSCLDSEQNRIRDTNVDDSNDPSALKENGQSLQDGEFEEGQIPDEWIEEEDIPEDCRKPPDVPETKEKHFAYDYGFMPHNAGVFPEKTVENKLQNEGITAGAKRKRKKAKKKKKNQKKETNCRGSFPGSEKPQNKQDDQNKAKNDRVSFPGPDKPQESKTNGRTCGVDYRSLNGSKGNFKTSESFDKQSTEKPVNDGGQIQEKGTAKKNGEISLASLLEGEIGLWTTETVDEVLHDMKVAKIGKRKARGPLTAERKAKKKIKKKKKRALKNKELGVKRLKLAPVTQSKPVILCKFYVKGQCTQGKHCPFSHDTVPITKSEICKYHMNRCCLKGEECPFSHDLSGIPCKFYHSKGYCMDGDTCRFSHKPITGKALQDILQQGEPEKQESYLKGSAQSSLCRIIASSMHNSDVQDEFSVGRKSEDVTYVQSSKAALESEPQMPMEKEASSGFPKPGKVNCDKSSNTTLAKEQKISEKEASLQLPTILSFQEHERFDYDIGAKGGNAALIAARKAASMVSAVAAGHEANLISRGLIRIPTFISQGHHEESRDMDVDNPSSIVNDGEGIEVPEQSRGDLPDGGNQKILPTGLLNGSKSAMKILEDSLRGNVEFDKDGKYPSAFCLFPSTDRELKTNTDNG